MIPCKKILLPALLLFFLNTANAQSNTSETYWPRFSFSNDVSAVRSFKKEQKFWAVGHTAIATFHISATDAVYFWFGIYSNGKFTNNLTATAKSITVTPLQINYNNKAKMGFRHFSAGWKHYLKGVPDEQTKWSMYGSAGFGIILGNVTNTSSIAIDSLNYSQPVLNGKGNFKRLTVDLGLGAEYPLGSDFYLYAEGKVWLPTTDYPSKYIFVNEKAPLVGLLGVGLRLLF